MSRRVISAPKPTGLTRNASSASLAMPPPSKLPNRPPSVISSSSSALPRNSDDAESRSGSPKKGGRKTIAGSSGGAGKGGKLEGENGEINIQVVVRCRGRSSIELSQASPIITSTTGPLTKSITVETTPLPSSSMSAFTTASSYGGSHQPMTKTYPFDKVFGPEADQTMVFREVAEGMLDEVLAGYNCTIFAYGQTGTGKTYTMQGNLDLSPLNAPRDEAGIVPRVLHRLFSLLESSENTEYSVKCSYVELYNEEVRDLLSDEYQPATASEKQPMSLGNGQGGGGLKLYEDGKKGVMIQGLEETGVRNLKEALAMVNKGCQRRQVAETKMNTESSRSHTIFSITVHVKETSLASGGDDLLRIGKFNLVDLAGSEAIGRSGATDKRAREAGMINQSLLTLGRVISALVEKGSHIPYRESKLTRLLQDSLGGRTKTCIVATVSPTRSNMEETLSTLDYAIRAKSIRNRPEVNAHLTKTGLLKEYLGDIEKLKAEVMAARDKNGIYIPEDQWREMHETQAKQKSDYEEAKLRANAATVELATKKKEFEELSIKMVMTSKELEEVREAERLLGLLMEELKVEMERVRVRLEEEGWVSKAYQNGEARIGKVAESLRGVANESVRDVGGLFDKLARKAKVLGKNADAATRFGAELEGLSKEMKTGLKRMDEARAGFGGELQAELEQFSSKQRLQSTDDLAALEESFSSFNALMDELSASIRQGHLETSEAVVTLSKIKQEVQVAVRKFAKDVSARSKGMVEEVLGHQQKHLDRVGEVVGSTADLVDTVIAMTREHMTSERALAERAKKLAEETAQAEISRLRNQNALLVTLLTSEKAKTARLRTELVANLTNMIESFTDAQDQSWSAVVEGVKVENERGMSEMEGYMTTVDREWQAGDAERANLEGSLEVQGGNGQGKRSEGQRAVRDVSTGLRTRLEVYGKETTGEAKRFGKSVDAQCEIIGQTSAELQKRSDAQGETQARTVGEMSSKVTARHQASRERTQAVGESIETLSTGLLQSHSSSSKQVHEYHASTSSALASLITSTETFLTTGIQEDISTGVTPRKKAWSVQQEWERTGPREVLISEWRRRKAEGIADEPEPAISDEQGGASHSRGSSVSDGNHVSPGVSGDGEHTVVSLSSSASLEDGENVDPTMEVRQVAGLAQSLRAPTKIGGLGGSKRSVAGRDEAKPNMVILGEGAVNVPRRGRK